MNKHQIIQTLKEHLANTQLSQNTLAKQIGISAATLSQILNDKIELVSEEMWNKIAAFLRMDDWKLFATPNFQAIMAACDDARERSRFLAISGYTGSGKTTALRRYAGKVNNTFYMLADSAMGKKDFLRAILKALGMDYLGSIYDMLDAICSRLTDLSNPVLMIDDFGKLNDTNMRLAQIIYDRTERRAGLIIAGTPHMQKYLNKMADKDKMGFQELRSRIAYWLMMKLTDQKTVAEICNYHGITDRDVVNYLYKCCKEYRSLREAITNAKRAKEQQGGQVNLDLVMDLVQQEGGE